MGTLGRMKIYINLGRKRQRNCDAAREGSPNTRLSPLLLLFQLNTSELERKKEERVDSF